MTSSLPTETTRTLSTTSNSPATISPTSLPPTVEVTTLDSLTGALGVPGTAVLLVNIAVGSLGLFVICVGVLCIGVGQKRRKKRRRTVRMRHSKNMEQSLLEESYNTATVSHSKLSQHTSFTEASKEELHNPRGFSTSINESYDYVFSNNPQPEEGIYDNDPGSPDTSAEEEDIYDNDPLSGKPRPPSLTIAVNGTEDDENIYDNDPTPNSASLPPKKPRLPSITLVPSLDEEDENIYDNDSPPNSAKHSSAVVITNEGTEGEYYESIETWTGCPTPSPNSPRPGDEGEENIYDNDPRKEDSCSENEYLELTPMHSPLPKDEENIYD